MTRTFVMIPFLLFLPKILFVPFLLYFEVDWAALEFIPPSTFTSYSAALDTTEIVFETQYTKIWRLSLDEALRDESTRRLDHGNAGRRPKNLVEIYGRSKHRTGTLSQPGYFVLWGWPPI